MNETIANWDGRIHGELDPRPSPHFRLNHGTLQARDRDVWQSIFVQDEYNCPNFAAHDIVVDIGMHIGSFSCLAHTKGSRKVFGYEVDKSAYDAACLNMESFGDGMSPYNYAVVRSDRAPEPVFYIPGSMLTNATEETGLKAIPVKLDSILDTLPGPVRFLKIDCEGSEFPILYTSQRLDRVQEIAGEWHDWLTPEHPLAAGLNRPCNAQGMEAFLREQGFATEFTFPTPTNGNFFARRET